MYRRRQNQDDTMSTLHDHHIVSIRYIITYGPLHAVIVTYRNRTVSLSHKRGSIVSLKSIQGSLTVSRIDGSSPNLSLLITS